MDVSGVRVYRQDDGTAAALDGETVAVIGYGNLGRSMALNLRDSGVRVVVGNIDDECRSLAAQEGLPVSDIAAAVAVADVVYVLVPDEVIPAVWSGQITPAIRAGATVVFASGYVLAYGLVDLPAGVDVLLLAPRMLGTGVRQSYLDHTGFLSYISVEQDATGRARPRLLALAAATGSLLRGAIELSAKQEATLDLFIEQSVGPYLGLAFQLAFAIGTEAGLPPEVVVAELYMSGEMSQTIQTMARMGFFQSVTGHGLVATYGGFMGTQRVDVTAMDRHFRETLEHIRSGDFARKLQDEEHQGYPTLAAIEAITKLDNPLTDAEDRLRAALGAPVTSTAAVAAQQIPAMG